MVRKCEVKCAALRKGCPFRLYYFHNKECREYVVKKTKLLHYHPLLRVRSEGREFVKYQTDSLPKEKELFAAYGPSDFGAVHVRVLLTHRFPGRDYCDQLIQQ